MAKRPHVPGQLGLFKPDSDWTVPTELPDLRGRPLMAIDTETEDRGLAGGRGPGWVFGRSDRGGAGGHLCGVSYAVDGQADYLPVRHPETDCLPLENVLRWADDHFRAGVRIVMHNGPYDVGWLGTYGVAPPDHLEDTLAGAVLLDETCRTYSLDACCGREGIPGKDVELLREAVRAYGGNPAKPAADIWRVPAKYAAPYAAQDGAATLELWSRQEGALRAQGVWDAYRTEIELIPMVVAMRRRGIRLDVEKATATAREFRRRRDAIVDEVSRRLSTGRKLGMDDLRSSLFLERVMTAEGVQYPMTAGGRRGSFSKDWMEKHDHWLPRLVTAAVKYEDAATKFVENYLLGYSHRGRVHAEIHQFLSEEGGTRSHRFSYSEPPLQQMPSPDKDPRESLPDEPGKPKGWGKGKGALIEDHAVGTLIRRLLLPEKGEYWGAADYSQQEPRVTVHFASACRSTGAQAAVERYIDNPKTDYHTMVAEMTGQPRPRAKILNLGMTYGKGKRSLAEELGLPLDEAEEILRDYHERLPFIKSLEDTCKRRAGDRGYIRLIDGARIHYPQWEGGWIDWDVREAARAAGKNMNPCSLEEANERRADPDHPWSRTRLRRADTRKALNNLVQGSAARQTKRAMLAMWREGVLPLIQMHDEIGASYSEKSQMDRVVQLMIETTPLVVPIIVDAEVGLNWGDAKMSWDECAAKYPLQRAA